MCLMEKRAISPKHLFLIQNVYACKREFVRRSKIRTIGRPFCVISHVNSVGIVSPFTQTMFVYFTGKKKKNKQKKTSHGCFQAFLNVLLLLFCL